MITLWSGTVSLTEGQEAVVETQVVGFDDDGFHLVLTLDDPAFTLNCYYSEGRFFCETPGYDFLVSAEELDMFPEIRRYKVRIVFTAVHTATTTAEWNIASGNATLEQSSLIAD